MLNRRYTMQLSTKILGLGIILFSVNAAHAQTDNPDSAPITVSAQEFQWYKDYVDGREDPRLQKFSDAAKKKKIARQMKISLKQLNAVIKKLEPLAESIGENTQKAIRKKFDETPLKGRIKEVMIDAEQGHVVAGVQWSCGDLRDHDKEAAWVAWSTKEAGSIVKTLALWCVDAKGRKIFSAKIGRTAFERISKRSIDRFATSRYLRLFEDVKRGPHE